MNNELYDIILKEYNVVSETVFFRSIYRIASLEAIHLSKRELEFKDKEYIVKKIIRKI